tara:strand:- start:2767 stop:3228 length:462 start_codon:yes stop_codon:yes gene_type:complete
MKKTSFTLLLIFSIFIFFPSAVKAKLNPKIPLWHQVDYLNCRGEHYIFCKKNKPCKKEKSTAKWQVDFKNSRIIYLTTKYSEGILNKFFRYYPNINISVHTLFIEGRLMKFNMDNLVSSNPMNKVEAITQGYSFGSKSYSQSSTTTTFSCFYR